MYDNPRPSLAGHIVFLANDVPRPDAAVAPPRSRIPNAGERRRVAAASLASLARDIGRTGVGDPRFAIRARSCRASLDASVVGEVRPPRLGRARGLSPDPAPDADPSVVVGVVGGQMCAAHALPRDYRASPLP